MADSVDRCERCWEEDCGGDCGYPVKPLEEDQIWGFQQIVTLEELGLRNTDHIEMNYDPQWKGLIFRVHIHGKRRDLQTALDRLATLTRKWSEDARRDHQTR